MSLIGRLPSLGKRSFSSRLRHKPAYAVSTQGFSPRSIRVQLPQSCSRQKQLPAAFIVLRASEGSCPLAMSLRASASFTGFRKSDFRVYAQGEVFSFRGSGIYTPSICCRWGKQQG